MATKEVAEMKEATAVATTKEDMETDLREVATTRLREEIVMAATIMVETEDKEATVVAKAAIESNTETEKEEEEDTVAATPIVTTTEVHQASSARAQDLPPQEFKRIQRMLTPKR